MRTKRELLHDVEWHDLPVDELSIASDGVSLSITPYDEATRSYRQLRFSISNAENLQITIVGTVHQSDLQALEVNSLELTDERDDRLSGRLGIVPGAAGFWTIEFSGAAWQLTEHHAGSQSLNDD